MWTCPITTTGRGTSSVIYKYLQIKPGAQVLHVPFNVYATTTAARFQLPLSAIHIHGHLSAKKASMLLVAVATGVKMSLL